MTISPSPIVALNRAIAVGQRDGPARGLEEIAAIEDCERLSAYPFYEAALGELELRCGRNDAAREHFKGAQRLARNPMERRFLDQRLDACGRPKIARGVLAGANKPSRKPAGSI
jgi:predicted RNA polymerase sigma factor